MTGDTTIGELARAFGVTPRTLRFYEDKGLITPMRRGQSRIYSEGDRARLELALQAKRAGFSLAEVKDILDLADFRLLGTAHLKAAIGTCRERIRRLEAQRSAIDATLTGLQRALTAIETRLAGEGKKDAIDLRSG